MVYSDLVLLNTRPTYNFMGVRWTRSGQHVPMSKPLPEGSIKWRVEDQAWAVEEGFFVERSRHEYKPVLSSTGLHTRMKHHPDWHYVSYSDGARSIETIERHVFWMTPGYDRLFRFIEQQDKHAYSGAWHPNVERFSPKLGWYKHYITKTRDRRSKFDAERRAEIERRESSERRALQTDAQPPKIVQRMKRYERTLEEIEARRLKRNEDARWKRKLDYETEIVKGILMEARHPPSGPNTNNEFETICRTIAMSNLKKKFAEP